MSCGSVREHLEEQTKDVQYDALTSSQLVILNALVEATATEKKDLSVADLTELAYDKATKPQKVYVSKTVNRLVEIGLAYEAGSQVKDSRYKHKTFMATGWAVSKHQIAF